MTPGTAHFQARPLRPGLLYFYRCKLMWANLLRLSRWKEHIPFTVPATLLGVNMAAATHPDSVTLDGRVIIVCAANVLAVTCAFMINDVEDAADDARDPARAARNPVASGDLSRRAGWGASLVVGALALALYAVLTREAFWAGVLTVILAGLYSWRRVRLKALPVVDVVSHALMLSALLVLVGYLAYDAGPGRVWWVVLGAGLVSVYGQLYNQVRDYDLDRAAGLRNTASVIGPRRARRWMYAALVGAAGCLAITLLMGLWPLWLVVVPVGVLPLWLVWRPVSDMRGSAAVDLSGRAQLLFFVAATLLTLVWLGANAFA
jgi:4-hydroxybenzoate polyprenyltransferase